jgi:hypothetical protein
MIDLKRTVPIGLFIAGIVYWYLFYFRGLPTVTHGDWAKEHVYLNTIRSALENGTIPWVWANTYYNPIILFMANPEVCFTPDVLLVYFLSNKAFFYFHHCLLYAIGFYGLSKIKDCLQLKGVAFFFLFLLFNFNGLITSHISEGHLQWAGYYFIPLFLYCTGMSYGHKDISQYDLAIGLILGALFANGSLHIAVFLALFMLILYVFDNKSWLKLFFSVAVGLSVGAFRIIPSLRYTKPEPSAGVQSGYPDIGVLFQALTQLRGHGLGTTTSVGWWEYSLYVGFSAFFVIIAALIVYTKKYYKSHHLPWVIATLLMFLLSLGNVWSIFAALHVPLANVERLSARFIVVPFVICIIVAAYCVNKFLLNQAKSDKRITYFFYLLLFFMTTDMLYQFLNWSLITTQLASGGSKLIPEMALSKDTFINYQRVIYMSWVITVGAFVASAYVFCTRWLNEAGRSKKA